MAEIETLDGYTVLVDHEINLALELKGYGWRTLSTNGCRYAWARIGGTMVLMHRLLMQPKSGETVIHLNRNGLDNRRSNLFIGRAPSCPLSGIVFQRYSKQGG